MSCSVKAKMAWDFIIDKPVPVAGYYIHYPHTRKAIAFGVAALVIVAAIGLIAYSVFSGTRNEGCESICQAMTRHRCIVPLTFVVGGILSASFLFTFFWLIRYSKSSPMTLETKTLKETEEQWHEDAFQPIYINYDPNTLHAYLLKNYENKLILTSKPEKGKVFVDKPAKRIEQNPDQLIHIETGLNFL